MTSPYSMPVSLLQQSMTEFLVTLAGVIVVSGGALVYFRKVRQERPPVGTFNGRDITILLALIIGLPFLYAALPSWAITCVLALTFAAALSIGYRLVWGAAPVWAGIGILLGANIWTSHTMMGSTAGWELWWAQLDLLVALAAIAVANLYVQGGMKLKHVAWFGLTLALYDAGSTLVVNVTAVLVEDFIGHPLDPTFGIRGGVNNYGIGIGDLLFYALFVLAAYKAYGKTAARVAMTVMVVFGAAAPSLFPLIHDLVDFRNDVVIPSQLFFAPAAFVTYLWLRHHYGPERTMAEYRATTGVTTPAQPAPEPNPSRNPSPSPRPNPSPTTTGPTPCPQRPGWTQPSGKYTLTR